MKKNTICLLLCGALLSGSIIPTTHSIKAEEKVKSNYNLTDFISFVDKYVKINKDNFYVLENEIVIKQYIKNNFDKISKIFDVKTSDELLAKIKSRLSYLNVQLKKGEFVLLSDKEFASKDSIITIRSGHNVSNHWWGVRHSFDSGSAGRDWADEIDNIGSVAGAIATVFPLGYTKLAGALTSLYLNTLSSDTRAWANKAPDGFNVDIAWTLNYRMYAH